MQINILLRTVWNNPSYLAIHILNTVISFPNSKIKFRRRSPSLSPDPSSIKKPASEFDSPFSVRSEEDDHLTKLDEKEDHLSKDPLEADLNSLFGFSFPLGLVSKPSMALYSRNSSP